MTSSRIAPTTESAPQQIPDDLQEALQAVPQPGQLPAVKKRVTRPRLRSPRGRAIRFLFIVGLIATGWWGSGYVFAYTDDAYLTSDLVSVTPEVTGPVEAVHVTDTSG